MSNGSLTSIARTCPQETRNKIIRKKSLDMRISRTIFFLFPVLLLFTRPGHVVEASRSSSSSSSVAKPEREDDVENSSKDASILEGRVPLRLSTDDEAEEQPDESEVEVTNLDTELSYTDPVFENPAVKQRFYGRKPMDRCEELVMRMGDDYRMRHENRQWYNGDLHSLPTVCTKATENPFGSYTSHKVPCTFKFHLVEDNDEVLDGAYEMSNKCSSKNVAGGGMSGKVKELKDHVDDWPDECVGDIKRCYSLQYHDDLLWKHLCRRNWTIPEGATHLSVTCQDDKRVKQEERDEMKSHMQGNNENINNRFDPRRHHEIMRQHADAHHEFLLKALVIILIAVMVICLLCFVCANRLFFQPYLRSQMKKSKSDSELTALVVDEEDGSDHDLETSGRRKVVKS